MAIKKLFPQGTKRRLLMKLMLRFAQNPVLFCRQINHESLVSFLRNLKSGEIDFLEGKIDFPFCITRKVPAARPLIIQKVNCYTVLVFPLAEKPQISIIIPAFNNWQYTYGCLKAVLEHTADLAYEVIIGDDVSSDQTSHAGDYLKNVHIVRNAANFGFLKNCNNIAQYARGDFLLFLNNDTNVQPGWLQPLLALITSDEKIGMVGSKLVYPDGKLQEAGGIVWNDASGWNYGRFDNPEKPEYSYVKEVDYISGASLMIKKSLWNDIGGFDPRYAPAYYEDTDLAFEVRKRGFKVCYQPLSVVAHFEGITCGRGVNAGIKKQQVINQQTFFKKWQATLSQEHSAPAEDVCHARDRSQGKTTVLVIDHAIPQWDNDAGSRATFQYLRFLCDSGYSVKFLPANYRNTEPYITVLQQMGIEVLCSAWHVKYLEEWLRHHAQMIDYVYLNRPHIAIEFLDLIKKTTHAKIIYQGHDLHYLREKRAYQISGDKKDIESSHKWQQIEENIFIK